jgi:UTP--glucose-1-phosphate uridylyltransferase
LFRFYPPGHGNVFASLQACGLLDKLIQEGRDVIFVSNVDNTAAAVDVRIASVICRKDVDYVMEITEKTQQDIKARMIINLYSFFPGRNAN